MAGASVRFVLCGFFMIGLVLTIISTSETCCGAASYEALVAWCTTSAQTQHICFSTINGTTMQFVHLMGHLLYEA
jgi:hypothetical protein